MEESTKTLSNGFACKIDADALDDYELFEDLAAVDRGEVQKLPTILTRLLGAEQLDALKNHLRGKNGRVKLTDMSTAVEEILFSQGEEGKNS